MVKPSKGQMPNDSFNRVEIFLELKSTSDTIFWFLIPETIGLHTHLMQILITLCTFFFLQMKKIALET